MSDYAVSIISHRRPVRCALTVAMMLERAVPADAITVHVSDPADIPAYQEAMPLTRIIPGAPTLPGNRNAVTAHHPEGTPVVCADDDIDGVVRLGEDGKLTQVPDLAALFSEGFETARDFGATLWGLAPSANAFYMKRRVGTGLKFVIGNIHGLLNRRAERLTCHVKDDYERSLLRYTTDGTVVRLDWVAAQHKYNGNTGGLAAYGGRTTHTAQADVDSLTHRWPDLVHINPRRKSPYPEILLRARKGAPC